MDREQPDAFDPWSFLHPHLRQLISDGGGLSTPLGRLPLNVLAALGQAMVPPADNIADTLAAPADAAAWLARRTSGVRGDIIRQNWLRPDASAGHGFPATHDR